MIHELKIATEFFQEVISGRKTFEIRENDRNFKVGDLLALNECRVGDDNKISYTGASCLVEVDYILKNTPFLKNGYVCLSIKPCIVRKYTEEKAPLNGRVSFIYKVPIATSEDKTEGR